MRWDKIRNTCDGEGLDKLTFGWKLYVGGEVKKTNRGRGKQREIERSISRSVVCESIRKRVKEGGCAEKKKTRKEIKKKQYFREENKL